jgi:uracil-DNA glycosylase family 4
MPNFLRQNFSCCGGLSLRTTEPAINVNSLMLAMLPLSKLDKHKTNVSMGDKKIIRGIIATVSVNDAAGELDQLNSRVIACKKCPRLVRYIHDVGAQKVKRFSHDDYWAKPLPSWGDPHARLLIVGLAPAAHGGNRTGRMFTGDSSGDWLAKAMHQAGFASKPISRSRDDGLVLTGAYITAAVRCAPPGNKPTPQELASCSQYLMTELQVLADIKVVLALGKIGFDAYCRAIGAKGLAFAHGAQYKDVSGRTLLASYHPSRQNTNTGRLTWKMWTEIFATAKLLVSVDGNGKVGGSGRSSSSIHSNNNTATRSHFLFLG